MRKKVDKFHEQQKRVQFGLFTTVTEVATRLLIAQFAVHSKMSRRCEDNDA